MSLITLLTPLGHSLNIFTKYFKSCSILMFLASFILGLATAQALLGRDTPEAINYVLVSTAFIMLQTIFSQKTQGNRNPLVSVFIFLIPSIFVAIGALITLPQEASTSAYREIEFGIKYAKNDEVRNEIESMVQRDMEDGKISRWEAIAIRRFVFDKNHILIIPNDTDTQENGRN